MTQEEILDYNKRCAEFMGKSEKSDGVTWTFPSYLDGLLWVDEHFFDGTNEYNGRRQTKVSELKFHSDWNWIHKVIEKINQCRITVPMNGIKDSIVPYIENRRPIVKGLINNNKESVVQAINQFLIWYNKQN